MKLNSEPIILLANFVKKILNAKNLINEGKTVSKCKEEERILIYI